MSINANFLPAVGERAKIMTLPDEPVGAGIQIGDVGTVTDVTGDGTVSVRLDSGKSVELNYIHFDYPY